MKFKEFCPKEYRANESLSPVGSKKTPSRAMKRVEELAKKK